MTPRQKKGIGYGITGGLFMLFGIVYGALPADPAWLDTVALVVGTVAGALGFRIVTPNTED